MNPDPLSARQALENARQAVREGDRRSARRWAGKAAALLPHLEEPWLILAGVASPRASVAYLERALRINPGSERARRGLEWARERLKQEKAAQPRDAAAKEPETGGRLPVRARAESLPATVPAFKSPPRKSLARPHWSFAAAALLLVCVLVAAVFWPGQASPARALFGEVQSTPVLGAAVDVDKPTYTPTFTSTFTPTATFTSTPTFTATFTPTQTFTPTNTPLPTNTPFLPATEAPTRVSSGGVRWIDVDLSDQMLYAYEGNTIVASFLVSTGVPAFPTVVGQFRIYIKLESTLMAGDGYYLPNVPYTMYFYKGYGIHGTYWHSNFGHPMSHGCVNMYTPDSEWLFYWAPLGTLVNVHY